MDNKCIFVAVKNNELGTVKKLLNAQTDVNACDFKGRSLLHWVKSPSMAALLLNAHANVNLQDAGGKTPLHWIADPKTIIPLIEAKADVNLQDNTGKTALGWAAGKGYVPVVSQLIVAGADINAPQAGWLTILQSASFLGQYEMVAHLLGQLGIEVDKVDHKKNRSALHWALRGCHGSPKKQTRQNSIEVTARIILALVKNNANPLLKDGKKRSPEFWIDKMECSINQKRLLKHALYYHSLSEKKQKKLLADLQVD